MKPFRINGRSGWHAEVRLADGRTTRKSFPTQKDAQAWMVQEQAKVAQEKAPAFGGPTRITLGALLFEYAKLFTLNKGGYRAELTRINNYAQAVGLPGLCVQTDEAGRRSLHVQSQGSRVPEGLQAYLERRRARSQRTFARMHALATKLCSQVTTEDIEQLKRDMLSDNLSQSTAQKEIALLKHCFNMAVKIWKWKGFENPCEGVELGKSAKRFVVLSQAESEALTGALQQCDNPLVWPLVELAISSAMRKGSLMRLRWEHVDLQGRKAHIWAKGRWADVPLSQRSVEILQRIPRLDAQMVFPMSTNALNMAWKKLRVRAGLPKLQFRDLRHLAPTQYARKGATATAIKQLLGHTSTRMAEFYIDMSDTDVVNELDRLDAVAPQSTQPLPAVYNPQGPKKHPRARKGPMEASEASAHSLDQTAHDGGDVPEATSMGSPREEACEPSSASKPGVDERVAHLDGNIVYLRHPTPRAA